MSTPVVIPTMRWGTPNFVPTDESSGSGTPATRLVAPPAAVGRVDAREKVLGAPLYAADRIGTDLTHAMTATATIGTGRITRIDTTAARALPGVLLVFTHEDALPIQAAGFLFGGQYGAESFQPLTGPDIIYRGQTIALVVADTLEVAIEATALIDVEYAAAPPSPTLDSPGTETVLEAVAIPMPAFADLALGDADAAFAASEVRIDSFYETPAQHHNPIEMISVIAEWRDGRLVIQQGTQGAETVRNGLALQLGIDPATIDVISPYIGGAFGQKGLHFQTSLVAEAARRLSRPVKLVVPRTQLFHNASFRPASRHRIQLGGDESGRMLVAIHETDHQTSRHDLFTLAYTASSAALYPWEHFRGTQRLVRADTQTPGFMRCPSEHPALFAMESAVDEFASRIGMDPVALRIANDTMTDTVADLPFSSRHVVTCLERGAELFGWSDRSAAPGSMVADDGSLIGWGVAIGAYPASTAPADARLRLTSDGRARVAVAGHEMGQGIRGAIAAQVAGTLSLPADRIEIVIGDTRAVAQHLTSGSFGTATAIPAIRVALDDLLSQVAALDDDPSAGRLPHEILAAAGRDAIEGAGRHQGIGQSPDAFVQMEQGLVAPFGPLYPEFAAHSYIAHFVEVRVEPTTRRVRVPRVVSVADCGRVMNRTTAASQVRGGVVWGIGATLRERSEVDPRYGGFLNAELAEYITTVNADIGEITIDFIDEPDPLLNRDGVKGLGEVVMAGVAPAIANAIFHATGQRHRSLPIRIEDLLENVFP